MSKGKIAEKGKESHKSNRIIKKTELESGRLINIVRAPSSTANTTGDYEPPSPAQPKEKKLGHEPCVSRFPIPNPAAQKAQTDITDRVYQ